MELARKELRVEQIQFVLAAAALATALTAFALSPAFLPPFARQLPRYALYSVGRIAAAYVVSLAFALSMGFAAARNRVARNILLPTIDILQSVPVVGFFPVAISIFIAIFTGDRLGVELASIFLIFTSQAWNMAFGVYESIVTIPKDITRLTEALGVTGSLAALRVFLPATVPNLVYNSMVSWANSWFFLMSSEVFAIGVARYELPGLGYYLYRSSQEGDFLMAGLGLFALFLVVILMEVFVWRPLTQWSRRFTYQMVPLESEASSSFVLSGLVDLAAALRLGAAWGRARAVAVRLFEAAYRFFTASEPVVAAARRFVRLVVYAALLVLAGAAGTAIARFFAWLFSQPWPSESISIPFFLALSIVRLFAVYCLAAGVTVAVAYVVYFHPRLGDLVLAVSKVMASIPGTALIPLVLAAIHRPGVPVFQEAVTGIVLFSTMIWYLLFPVAGQVTNIPRELRESTATIAQSRALVLRKLVLPAAFPGFVTGSIAAWGGGWNALVVSEYIVFRGRTLAVSGIGALIDRAAYEKGDTVLLSLCLVAMVVTIIVSNRLVWQRLYQLASRKYTLEVE